MANSCMKLKINTIVKSDILGGPFKRYAEPKRTGICVTIVKIAAKR